jgi:HK97 family phage major capsid protein
MELTQEQIAELVASAATKAVEEFQKAAPATTKAAANVEVIKDESEQPFGGMGEYLMAVKNAALYPGRADVRLLSRSLKASGLSEGVPADGGYLIDQPVVAGIEKRMYSTGEILRRVSNVPVGPNSNGMTFNAVNETSRATGSRQGGITGYWMAEAGSKTASKPAFAQQVLKLKKVAALCYATDELLADATALEGWLGEAVPDELRFLAEDAIYNGDGVAKPLGIMSSTCLVSVTRIDANEIDSTDIANLWSRRWVGVNDYVWLVNPDIFPQLVNLTIGNWPVYVPAGGYSGAPYASIYGKPVIENEYSAALGTSGDIMLASLSQYRTITKGGIQSASSMHVQFLTDEMTYRWVYRIDGQPKWNSALTPFKGSLTKSPFVVLSTSS